MSEFTSKIKKYLWMVIFLLLLFGLIIPISINEIFKVENGYITLWNAANALDFYGNFLAFIGTVFLGYIAINQNRFIIETQTKSQCYSSMIPDRFEIYKSNGDNDKFLAKHPTENSENFMTQRFGFIFKDIGKVPAYEYRIIKFDITNFKQREEKYIFVNENGEFKGFRNSPKDNETYAGASINVTFDSKLMSEILNSDSVLININIIFKNSFNVVTTGEYRYHIGRDIENNRFKLIWSTCENESYAIEKNKDQRL